MSAQKYGRELKELQNELGVSNEEICAEAKISMSSLRAIFIEDPKVMPRTKLKVIGAFERLAMRRQASA